MPTLQSIPPLTLVKTAAIGAPWHTPTRPTALPPAINTSDRLSKVSQGKQHAPLTLLTPPAPAQGLNADIILRDIRLFEGQIGKTKEYTIADIPYYANAFWRPNGGGSHPLQKTPYRACYSGNLAEFFIERFSRPGAIVHDPFNGRGTTAVQSALMGRIAFGSDINPLSAMMVRPRLSQITMREIATWLDNCDLSPAPIENEGLLAYFNPSTLQQIEALRRALAISAPIWDENPDPVADWIRMIVIFRLTGHTSAYLSRRTLPPNQMTTLEGQCKLNASNGLPAPERDLREIVWSKSKALLSKGCVPEVGDRRIGIGSAWHTPWIKDACVDLVLTSPPFADVIDYAHENWIRAWFAGISLDDVAFSHHSSLDDWTAMIRRTLIEQMRVVKRGGYIAMEVGEIRKGSVALEQIVWQAAEGLPCRRLGVIVNRQTFTKSAHIFGVHNGTGGTNTNRIVIMQRN